MILSETGIRQYFAKKYCLVVSVLFFILSVATLSAQQIIIPADGITAHSGQEITQSPNPYELGTLTISVNFVTQGNASVTITLPEGVTAKNGSLSKTSGVGDIANVQGYDTSSLTFELNNASGSVTLSLTKLISPLAHRNNIEGKAGFRLQDRVEIATGGNTLTRESNVYTYTYPILTITEAVGNNDVNWGENTGTFKIKNGGTGKAYDIYLSVQYPTGVEHSEISHNGQVLTPVSNTGSKYLFKLESNQHSNGGGLANGQELLLQHKYNVRSVCVQGNITYDVNWGESDQPTDWYEYKGNVTNRTLAVAGGGFTLSLKRTGDALTGGFDYTKTYFTPYQGLNCVAKGQPVGKIRWHLKNYANNNKLSSGVYDLVLYLREFVSLPPKYLTKIKIINPTTQAETPFTDITIFTDKRYQSLSFRRLTTDPDGTGQGLEDLDHDGFYDDLPPNNELIIEVEMIKDFESNVCDNRHEAFELYAGYQNYCGVKTGGNLDNASGALQLLGYGSSPYYFALYAPNFANDIPAYITSSAKTSRIRLAYQSFEIRRGASNVTRGKHLLSYKVTLPDGVVAQNIKWVYKYHYPYETTDLRDPAPASTLTGKDLHIIAPVEGASGYVIMDLKSDCSAGATSGEKTIKYQVLVKEDVTYSTCEQAVLCGEQKVNVVCQQPCNNDGPSLEETTAERSENSYGWKDYTLAEKHTKATMPPLMIRRALYLDDFEVIAKGKQKGTGNNLYYSMTTNKGVSVKPKSLRFTFTSGARNGQSVDLPATLAHVTATGTDNDEVKKIVWNLTQALAGTPLQNDDTFEVKATYQVDKNSGQYYDFAMATESYFYMLDGNTQKYCGNKDVPLFFVARTFTSFGTNAYTIEGCNETNIGGNLIYMARRFASSGTPFVGEYRPDRLVKSIKITLPKTYTLKELLYYTQGGAPSVAIPLSDLTSSVVGDNIVYTIDNTYDTTTKQWRFQAGLMQVHNNYSSHIQAKVQPTCGSETNHTEKAITEVQFYDYFYHYGLRFNGATPPTDAVIETSKLDPPIIYRHKPNVALEVQGNDTFTYFGQEQTLSVRLRSMHTLYASPYTWLSIPDMPGEVEVLGVYHNGTPLTKQNANGESLYHLDASLPAGTHKDYTIKVRLLSCQTKKVKVYAGYNCTSFPTSYTQTCHADNEASFSQAKAEFTLVPAVSEVQLSRLSTPNPDDASLPVGQQRGKLGMCQDNWYEYEINNGKQGSVFNPKIAIYKEQGIEITSVEVIYPYNSTTKRVVTGVENGNRWEYSLLQANESLPGLLTTTDIDARKIKVRLNVQPQCNFRVGSTFAVQFLGENPCGDPVEGNRDSAVTALINGINAMNYAVASTLTYQSGNADKCSSDEGALYKGKHQILASGNHTGGTNGKAVLRIPQGFEMVANSFKGFNQDGSANASIQATLHQTIVATNEKEYYIQVPDNLPNNAYFTYEFKVKQVATHNFTDCRVTADIQHYAIEQVTGITCKSATCPALEVLTSNHGRAQITFDRANITIENVRITNDTSVFDAGKEKLRLSFDLKNATTAPYTGEINVALYNDTNNNGMHDTTEAIFDKIFVPSATYNAGSTTSVSKEVVVSIPQVCNLRIAIFPEATSCLCAVSDVPVTTPTHIEGITQDITLCEGETLPMAYVDEANTNYDAYEWSSTTAGAINYLSATNQKKPTFTYNGTKLTSEVTLQYQLKLTRQGNCQSTQVVNVKVLPTPAKVVVVTTPESCTSPTIHTITPYNNAYEYEVYQAGNKINPVIGANGTISGLVAGTAYTIRAKKGNCTSENSDEFIHKAQLPVPNAPTISKTSASCGAVSTHRIDGYSATSGLVYEVYEKGNPTALTHITFDANGTLQGLQAGKTYSVKAKQGNCLSVSSVEFVVEAELPIPNAPSVTDQTFCWSASTAVFKATAITGNTLRWYNSATDSAFDTNLPSVSLDVNAQTTYIRYVSQVNAQNCESAKVPVRILVNPKITAPTLTATNPMICSGETAEFTITAEAGTIVDYDLNGNKQSVSLTSATHTISVDNVTTPQTLTLEKVKKPNLLFEETFGTGQETCAPEVKQPRCRANGQGIDPGSYAIVNKNSTWYNTFFQTIWVWPNDHTSQGTDDAGRYLFVDLGPQIVFYEKELAVMPNEDISVEFYYLNVSKPNQPSFTLPNVEVRLVDDMGAIVASSETGEIPNGGTSADDWVRYQASFKTGNHTNLKLQLYSKAPNHITGNDLAIDDIKVMMTCSLPLSETKSVGITPDNTASTQITPLNVCINDAIIIEHTTTGATGIGTATGLPAGVTAHWANNKITISGASSQIGQHDYTIPLTGGCGKVTATGTIIIKSVATPSVGNVTHPTCLDATGSVELSGLPSGNYAINYGTQSINANTSTYVVTGLVAGDYTFTITANGCVSAPTSAVTIHPQPNTPDTPTITTTPANCGAVSIHKIDNYDVAKDYKVYENGTTNPLTGITFEADGTIKNLEIGKTYSIKVLEGACYSASSMTFTTQDALPIPVKPIVVTQMATCTSESLHKVEPYDTAYTYQVNDQNGAIAYGASVAYGTGIISGLVAGRTYTIKALQGNCSSNSDTFGKQAQLLVPDQPIVATTDATCDATSQHKVTNYNNAYTYKVLDNTNQEVGSVDANGNITGLVAVGDYKVKAIAGTCDILSQSFAYQSMLPKPAKPEVETTPATCTSVSIHKVKSYDNTHTYHVYEGINEVGSVDTNGVISGLTAGISYTIKAKNNHNCYSEASDVFVFEAQLPIPNALAEVTRTECPSANTFDMGTLVQAQAGHTLRWYDDLTTTNFTTTAPTISQNVNQRTEIIKYVSQINANNCEGQRTKVTFVIDDTQEPTFTTIPSDLGLACNDTNFDQKVTQWLSDVEATDGCGGNVVITNNYNKPTDVCNQGTIEVTFTATDGFGNRKEHKASILLIIAKDDNFVNTPITSAGGVLSSNGQPLNILTNDKLYGNTPNTTQVTLIQVSSTSTNVSIDVTTGQIQVQPNTPEGTYTLTYKFCVTAQPNLCTETATITIKVANAPIIANKDTLGPINGKDGGQTPSVLDNDTLNGKPLNPTEITLTKPNLPTGITMDDNGVITISPDVPAGTYDVEYTICEKVNPLNCSTITSTIEVVAPKIEAVKDPLGPINGKDGGQTPSVLDNDTLNGKPLNPTEVTLTKPNLPTGITMDDNGVITISPDVPAGTYDVEYTICEKVNPLNCSTITSTIEVVAPKIDAVKDPLGPINGKDGGQTPSVLDNDTLNGKPLNPTEITLTKPNNLPPGITMDDNGVITISPDVPAGTYDVEYTICEKVNPLNCSTITSTIEVVAPKIDAVKDPLGPINGKDGGQTPSVLDNDTLNGKPLNPTEVTLTKPNNLPPGITMDDNGVVTISPNVPAGTYDVDYTICEKVNPLNCSTITSTIEVVAPKIGTNDDAFTIYSGDGGTTKSIFENDLYNNKPIVLTEINFKKPTNLPMGIVVNDDGTIVVDPSTPINIYKFAYEICDKLNPDNCSTSNIQILVTKPSNEDILDLVKTIHKQPIKKAGSKIVYRFVVTNNGTEVLSSVKLSDPKIGIINKVIPDLQPKKSVDLTIEYEVQQSDIDLGKIVNSASVTARTPSDKKLEDISDNNTPDVDEDNDGDKGNDPTIAILREIKANPDKTLYTGKNGGLVSNFSVLKNDTLEGYASVDENNVTLTYTDASGVFVINPDGSVMVSPNAPLGEHNITYQICDKVSDLCSSTTLTIEVLEDCELKVFNGMSFNGDGSNESLYIENIECYPDNVLRVFNRWGVEIFNTERYDNVSKVFGGISNGRVTLDKLKKLPQGTYYVVIEYRNDKAEVKRKGTWIYIKTTN